MSTRQGIRPAHPGEILLEEFMKPLGLSANAFARALAVPPPRVNDIVRERRGVSADTALRLSARTPVSAVASPLFAWHRRKAAIT